ncbi:expressed unknown protein [Seminavis robusta]|uniref:Uncharacterized protein n=1 Tax=Seminavis robusta TaxID=568900 RepID=A0A9N8E1G2_9STRA|nr:expressed unknown protein [Seminavis robusta]|eukprot:Sro523_g159760.1 n/a (157) ;mRNA; f:29338-29808
MDFEIPSFIFVPCMVSDSKKTGLPSAGLIPLIPASRWSEEIPSTSCSPPKLPKREIALRKIDSLPKLPRRSVPEEEMPTLSVAMPRRVRALPRPHQSVSTFGSITSISSTTVNLTRSVRSRPAQRSRFSASEIVEQVYEKTSRPGPERVTVAARAA